MIKGNTIRSDWETIIPKTGNKLLSDYFFPTYYNMNDSGTIIGQLNSQHPNLLIMKIFSHEFSLDPAYILLDM